MSLFDSSAIINLCGSGKVEKLFNAWTLNLAFYELGNAVWKQVHVRKVITVNEANVLLDLFAQVFGMLRKPEPEEGSEVLKIAMKENLTYYDAAYISTALKNGLALVTDDERLCKIGKKYVETTSSNEL
jgi:predicted nucleic acid-binding protein